MKALWYVSTSICDIDLIKARFSTFDFYIDFDLKTGTLSKATIFERRGNGLAKIDFPLSVFEFKFEDFILAIVNYLKPNSCSHYLLEIDNSIDLLKKIGNELSKSSDFNYISFDGSVHLFEGTIESIKTSSRLLTEFLIKEKDSIRIELFTSENQGYEEPHVHVFYKKEKVFKISLKDGFEILKVYKNVDRKVVRKAKELISDNLIKARTKWNDFSNKIKFVVGDDGKPTSMTYRT